MRRPRLKRPRHKGLAVTEIREPGPTRPRSRCRAADERAEAGQRVEPGTVIDRDAALVAVQQPGLVQDLQVMADRGLGQVERLVEVTDARLAAGMGGHRGHQPQPNRVGECLQQRATCWACAWDSGSADSGGQQTAVSAGSQHDQRLWHAPHIEDLNVLWRARQHTGDRQSSIEGSSHGRPVQLALTSRTWTSRSPSPQLLGRAGQGAARLRHFAIADPPLKLILMENRGQGGEPQPSSASRSPAPTRSTRADRLAGAGLASVDERDTTCCYARQDKFWVQNAPNGERWEIYTVLQDSPTFWGQDGGQSWAAAEAALDSGRARTGRDHTVLRHQSAGRNS